MVHEHSLPVATGLFLACHGCFSSEPAPAPAQPSCCTTPAVEVEAKAETPAPLVDEHGQPVVVRMPEDEARAGG